MREKKRLENMLSTEADLIRRSEDIAAYFELAGEYLARNRIESPRSLERKAAAAAAPPTQVRTKVRFWPYS